MKAPRNSGRYEVRDFLRDHAQDLANLVVAHESAKLCLGTAPSFGEPRELAIAIAGNAAAAASLGPFPKWWREIAHAQVFPFTKVAGDIWDRERADIASRLLIDRGWCVAREDGLEGGARRIDVDVADVVTWVTETLEIERWVVEDVAGDIWDRYEGKVLVACEACEVVVYAPARGS